MFDLALLAVYRASLRERRALSMRATAVAGMLNLIKSTRIERFFLLKRFVKSESIGPIIVRLPFDAADRRMIHEARLILQEQSLERLHIPQVIMLGFLSFIDDRKKGPPHID